MWEKNPKDFSDYDSFRVSCPKTFGSPNTKSGKVWNVVAGVLTLGVSALITKKIEDVGPAPGPLAHYITKNIAGIGQAVKYCSSQFDEALDVIKNDLENGDPVIALIAWGPFHMHYVNVVAVSEDDRIAYLDTDNHLKSYSISDFHELMDCSSYIPHSVALAPYNLIRFQKSEPV